MSNKTDDQLYSDLEAFETALDEQKREKEQLKAELAEYRQIGSEAGSTPGDKPKLPDNDDKQGDTTPEWQPPTYEDLQRQTDEVFAAAERGEIGEAEVHRRLHKLNASSQAPAEERSDPFAGRSYADVAKETADAFNESESETELLEKLVESGAIDPSAGYRIGAA